MTTGRELLEKLRKMLRKDPAAWAAAVAAWAAAVVAVLSLVFSVHFNRRAGIVSKRAEERAIAAATREDESHKAGMEAATREAQAYEIMLTAEQRGAQVATREVQAYGLMLTAERREVQVASREAQAATLEAIRYEPVLGVYYYLGRDLELLSKEDQERLDRSGLSTRVVLPSPWSDFSGILSGEAPWYIFFLFANEGFVPIRDLVVDLDVTMDQVSWKVSGQFPLGNIWPGKAVAVPIGTIEEKTYDDLLSGSHIASACVSISYTNRASGLQEHADPLCIEDLVQFKYIEPMIP